jgi:hypothetical protein
VVTVDLAPGVQLVLDELAAPRLLDALAHRFPTQEVAADPSRHAEVLLLTEDHPLWEQHSGLAGHFGREWDSTDLAVAEAFYASIAGKAKVFLDALIERPGEALDVDQICRLEPDVFSGSRSIAGAINGLRRAYLASGRRYPFYWWEGNPTRYAMKPSVAKLFAAARRRIDGTRGSA